MISKKLATTLGAGTLGAGGAAGAAALKLGLLGGNRYFANATKFDKKAIDSSNWKADERKKDEITIRVEEGEDTWQCTIKGVVFDKEESKRKSIDDQISAFLEKLKADGENRKNFVKNCAEARLNAEKTENAKDSTIELEVEEEGGNLKLKNLDNLLGGDFVGLERLEETGKYKNALNPPSEDSFQIDSIEKDGKILVIMKVEGWTCSISGKIEKVAGDGNAGYNFNAGPLSNIFVSETESYESDDDKYAKLEKRKFLIRNCSDNNGSIEGMKVVSYTEHSIKKWKFEDPEKELLTKIYEKPGTTKSQQAEGGERA